VTAGAHAASRRAQIAAADLVESCCATMMRRSVANPGLALPRRRIPDAHKRPRHVPIDPGEAIDALDENSLCQRMLHRCSVSLLPSASRDLAPVKYKW
jgi:hypothetical protein